MTTSSSSHGMDEPSPESQLRQSLARLQVQKQSIEFEAEAIVLELTSPPPPGEDGKEIPPMGVDTPLVDHEGYPRGDIDVYRARALRQRLQVLRTDHKTISKQLEQQLVQLAAIKNPTRASSSEQAARAAPKPKPKFDPVTGKWVVKNWDGSVAGVPNGDQRQFDHLEESTPITGETELASTTNALEASPMTLPSAEEEEVDSIDPCHPKATQPFAKVQGVAEGSPAHTAGLQMDDWIIQFGPLHQDNHDRLTQLATLVSDRAAHQRPIVVRVQRPTDHRNMDNTEREMVTLQLRPRPWNGRGLIGCHIVPFTPT